MFRRILGKGVSRASEPSQNIVTNVDKPSELKIALDNRAFEIQLFWQRSNYFLVLITAVGIAVFSVKPVLLALVMALFAATCSYFWYRTNLGSKFWQESWEVEVVALASQEGIKSFERSTQDIIKQVEKSLVGTKSSKGILHRLIDRQILAKPSVSYYMILLSLTSTLMWLVVSTYLAATLARSISLPSLAVFWC